MELSTQMSDIEDGEEEKKEVEYMEELGKRDAVGKDEITSDPEERKDTGEPLSSNVQSLTRKRDDSGWTMNKTTCEAEEEKREIGDEIPYGSDAVTTGAASAAAAAAATKSTVVPPHDERRKRLEKEIKEVEAGRVALTNGMNEAVGKHREVARAELEAYRKLERKKTIFEPIVFAGMVPSVLVAVGIVIWFIIESTQGDLLGLLPGEN